MLFHPWRDESKIIGDSESFKGRFVHVAAEYDIESKMAEYNHNCYELDNAMKDLEKQRNLNLKTSGTSWHHQLKRMTCQMKRFQSLMCFPCMLHLVRILRHIPR